MSNEKELEIDVNSKTNNTSQDDIKVKQKSTENNLISKINHKEFLNTESKENFELNNENDEDISEEYIEKYYQNNICYENDQTKNLSNNISEQKKNYATIEFENSLSQDLVSENVSLNLEKNSVKNFEEENIIKFADNDPSIENIDFGFDLINNTEELFMDKCVDDQKIKKVKRNEENLPILKIKKILHEDSDFQNAGPETIKNITDGSLKLFEKFLGKCMKKMDDNKRKTLFVSDIKSTIEENCEYEFLRDLFE